MKGDIASVLHLLNLVVADRELVSFGLEDEVFSCRIVELPRVAGVDARSASTYIGHIIAGPGKGSCGEDHQHQNTDRLSHFSKLLGRSATQPKRRVFACTKRRWMGHYRECPN